MSIPEIALSFQHQATVGSPLAFVEASLPKLNPSLSNEVKVVDTVASASVASANTYLVAPLTESKR